MLDCTRSGSGVLSQSVLVRMNFWTDAADASGVTVAGEHPTIIRPPPMAKTRDPDME
jgi:hypothetical protein